MQSVVGLDAQAGVPITRSSCSALSTLRLTPFLRTGLLGSGHPVGFVKSKEWITIVIDTLATIKSVAKRLARSRRLQHISALEFVARQLGSLNWRSLAERYKQGWRPTSEQMQSLEALPLEREDANLPNVGGLDTSELGDSLVFTHWIPDDVEPMKADEIHGELDGHTFYMVGDEFSVAIGSQGWEIQLDQPPSASPKVTRLGGRVKSVAALDPSFVERATTLLTIRARRMHAEVARDWPRRSTMPDTEGRALHPLTDTLSGEWHCLHCEGKNSGRAMANSLWHCPDCGATPIDIFPEPFLKENKRSA